MIGEVYKEILSLLKGRLPVYPAYQGAPEGTEKRGVFGILSPEAYRGGEKPEAVFVLTLMGSSEIEELMSAGDRAAGFLSEGELRTELSFGSVAQNKISELEYPLKIRVLLYEEEIPEEPEKPEEPEERFFVFPLSLGVSFEAESYSLSRKRAVQEISTADGRSLIADSGERRLVLEGKGRLSSEAGVLILEGAISDKRTFSFSAGGLILPPMILKSYEVKETGKSEFLQASLEFQAASAEGEVTV